MREADTILCMLYDDETTANTWNGMRKLILLHFDLEKPVTARCDVSGFGFSLVSCAGDSAYINALPGKQFEFVVNAKSQGAAGNARQLVEELEVIDDEGFGSERPRLSWSLEEAFDDVGGFTRKIVGIRMHDNVKVSIAADEPNMLVFSGVVMPSFSFDAAALRELPHLADSVDKWRKTGPAFGCAYDMRGAAPFKLGKNEAIETYERLVSSRDNLPKAFAQNAIVGPVTGVFIPMWVFEGDGYYCLTISRYESNETSAGMIYDHAKGEFTFKGISVDGSVRMPDASMDTLGAFDFESLVPLDSPELSGYDAECFSDPEENVRKRVLNLLGSTALHHEFAKYGLAGLWTRERALREAHRMHWVPHPDGSAVKVVFKHAARVLVPVWIIEVEYEQRAYQVCINGQTGATSAFLPNNIEEVQVEAKQDANAGLKNVLKVAAICCAVIFVGGLFVGNVTLAIALCALIGAVAGAFVLFADALPDHRKESAKKTVAMQEDKLAGTTTERQENITCTSLGDTARGLSTNEYCWPL